MAIKVAFIQPDALRTTPLRDVTPAGRRDWLSGCDLESPLLGAVGQYSCFPASRKPPAPRASKNKKDICSPRYKQDHVCVSVPRCLALQCLGVPRVSLHCPCLPLHMPCGYFSVGETTYSYLISFTLRCFTPSLSCQSFPGVLRLITPPLLLPTHTLKLFFSFFRKLFVLT